MEYNRLGNAGIKVSEIGYGSYLTLVEKMGFEQAKFCVEMAYDQGVNFFDTAEMYNNGLAEEVLGKIVKPFRREDLVISTKIFIGGDGPNDTGLSWKHLVEGVKNSLKRLDMEYVDLLYCHRYDPDTPIEETVRAMDYIIKSGMAFYWGTSKWSVEKIDEAYMEAKKNYCIPPSMAQPVYNLLDRNIVEREYLSLYEKYRMGLTTYSPLGFGVLSGKYDNGIPSGSRGEIFPEMKEAINDGLLNKITKLKEISEDLGCSLAQLSLAWCLKNTNVNSVIMGASSSEQIKENLACLDVKYNLTKQLMTEIDSIFVNEAESTAS